MVAVNKYYNGGVHLGDNNGWRIDPGHHFTNQSALLDPRDLPTNLKQVVGHPTIITESSWVAPLGYQSEGPFLMAAYQSLTGVNTFYWFSADTPEYQTDLGFSFLTIAGSHPLTKWSASVPEIMGEFPACALMYRKGYIKQGAPVVQRGAPAGRPVGAQDAPDRRGQELRPEPGGDRRGPVRSSPKAWTRWPSWSAPSRSNYGGDPALTKVARPLRPYIDAPGQDRQERDRARSA